MFMGVSLCTGLIKWKELQTEMLVINKGELTMNSSIFSAPQDSISAETLTAGRIQKHSFSTVFIKYSKILVKGNH